MLEKRSVLWAFQAPKWKEGFELGHKASWTSEEILEEVQKIEKTLIVWERSTSIGSFIGLFMIVLGVEFGTIYALLGLSGALVGQMTRFHAITDSSQKICMLHLLWDMRKREEEAVLNSEIQDL